MAWLLDTNILAELRRPQPEAKVVEFVARQPLDQLFVSAVTLAEIRFGIEIISGPRRELLKNWLASTVRPMFDGRILPMSEDILLRWRLLIEEGRRRGHTYSQPDLMIAATAAHHGLTVVSRDRKHFDEAGVRLVNPWD